MPYDLSGVLVVGISSSAVFDSRPEHEIFVEKGLHEFVKYQIEREDLPMPKGTAFPLVEALLRLNGAGTKPIVEVCVMSQNHPAAVNRVFNSFHHYGLAISRGAVTGGESVAKYLSCFNVSLFLSKEEADVRDAISSGCPAGLIYDPPGHSPELEISEIRIAFDGDGVLFSDEAQQIYDTQGLDAFHEYERLNANKPLGEGPTARFFRQVAALRDKEFSASQIPRIKIALVTARNSPAHERVIKTFRSWGVEIDAMFLMGGIPKRTVLEKFNPHIFFDDQVAEVQSAYQQVPTALVPGRNLQLQGGDRVPPLASVSTRPLTATKSRFESECRRVLRAYVSPYASRRLPAAFRDFISRNCDRPPMQRGALLESLKKYELPEGVRPLFNRAEGSAVLFKLRKVEETILKHVAS